MKLENIYRKKASVDTGAFLFKKISDGRKGSHQESACSDSDQNWPIAM